MATLSAVLTHDHYLFVHVPELTVHDATELRRFLVTLLEFAEDHLRCHQLVMCLRPTEGVLTKALVFVGFDKVSADVMAHDPSKVQILAYTL
ncbi:hypothetical protein HMI54_001007 [Coelomomyces lativittatus]|nr:hypothetical protein HMI55_001825 [Coelomomyces lativittatus]KAJ1511147.1 hypothetical protein HMI54_001007 [Coelomomyces lativittatus]